MSQFTCAKCSARLNELTHYCPFCKEVVAGPRPTGRRVEVTLTGMIFPWTAEGQPAFLRVPGSSALYLPLFSDPTMLKIVMDGTSTPYVKVKKIDDGFEFLDSIPKDIRIMVEPWFTPEGRVRWTEIER